MKEKDGLFHLGYDSLKWSFSKYTKEKYYEDVQKVILAVAETIFKIGYDVLSDSSLKKFSREKLIDLAKKYNYEVIEVNLVADYEILAKRFDERVARAKADPERKISNLSKERHKEIVEMFHEEKNPDAIIFRTDTQTEKEISENILKLF